MLNRSKGWMRAAAGILVIALFPAAVSGRDQSVRADKGKVGVLASLIEPTHMKAAVPVNVARTGFAPAPPGPRPGAPAPSLSLQGLDGKSYQVGGKREKWLLLNFWASWCGPCEEEAPLLVELFEKYKAALDLYAVNVTAEDSRANAEAFAQAFAFPFPVLLDDTGEAATKYRIFGIPTSFLINREGQIVDVVHLANVVEWEEKLSRISQP